MHLLGLHVYHPNEYNESNITLVNTVLENIKAFSKREIKVSNMTRQLYANMLYPSNMDFIWMIQNNHINKCDVTVRYIYAAQKRRGKDIYALKALKVKTTWTKPNPVAGYDQ